MQNNEKTNNKKNILLVLAYNRALTSKHTRSRQKKLYILLNNPEFRNLSVNKPTTTHKRNENIQDLTGSHLIKDGKVANKKLEKQLGKSKMC